MAKIARNSQIIRYFARSCYPLRLQNSETTFLSISAMISCINHATYKLRFLADEVRRASARSSKSWEDFAEAREVSSVLSWSLLSQDLRRSSFSKVNTCVWHLLRTLVLKLFDSQKKWYHLLAQRKWITDKVSPDFVKIFIYLSTAN